MRKSRSFGLVVWMLVASVAAFAAPKSGDAQAPRKVSVEGTIVCAKCTKQVEGQEECQNLLVVQRGEKEKVFYLTKNAVYEKYGEVCKDSRPVKVEGEVTRSEGKRWLAATKIEPAGDQS